MRYRRLLGCMLLAVGVSVSLALPAQAEITFKRTQLDDKFRRMAGEVADEWADGRLLAKVSCFWRDAAQDGTQRLLRGRHLFAQALGHWHGAI